MTIVGVLSFSYTDVFVHVNSKLEVIKAIITKNIKCKDSENEHLKIIFYYKNNKTSNLVIKNNPAT